MNGAGPTEQPALDLYWIPLGAGARVVRISGRIYEAASARLRRRPPRDLYHSALMARTDGGRTVIEVTPVVDDRGPAERGVVGEGPVGARCLRHFRVFRYEIRRWRGGEIPDARYAVASPVRVTDDPEVIRHVLDLVPQVPTPVWGRDAIHAGDMWNSNSVIAWLLVQAGVVSHAGAPPENGRAPGWDAGVFAAQPARQESRPLRHLARHERS